MKTSAIQLFYRHIKRQANGCITWNGSILKNGYGSFRHENKTCFPHRFLWEFLNGSVPRGMELHHICENKICVNPKHLKPVTRREHVALSSNHWSNKTHCKHGHAYTLENTRLRKDGKGKRECRECNKLRLRIKRQQRKTR